MNIILIILTFSLIIIIHELGHFLLAKANGIGVTEFSLGMGPRILSFTGKETRYSLKLFPFGGSCMMVGEDNMGDNLDAENAFNNKSVGARISVIIAGPIFNFILAFIVALIVIGNVGIDPARLTEVTEGSGASHAGLKKGDIVTEIDGSNVAVARELMFYFYTHSLDGSPIDITVKRDGEKIKTQVIPTASVKYIMGCEFESGTNKISALSEGYPLADTGAKVGDRITKINGSEITDGETLSKYLTDHPFTAEDVTLEITSGDEVTTKVVTPEIYTEYKLGIGYSAAREKVSFLDTIKYSYKELVYNVRTSIKSVGMLITGKLGMNQVSGPVGVVTVMNDIYKENIDYGMSMVLINFLNFGILISTSLGVMNLLPFPALDGGRLVFLVLEALRGKPINRDKEGMVHLIGFVALMVLMVFVLFNDVSKLFS